MIRWETLIESDKSFRGIQELSAVVGLDSKDEIERFYKREIDEFGYGFMYPYFMVSEYGECDKNFRARYMIVSMEDGDEVLVSLKMTTMFSSIYFRIYGYPISACGNRENEFKVIEELRKWECFNGCMFFTDGEDYIFTNYYNVIDEILVDMNTNSWKKRRKLNKIVNDMRVVENSFSMEDIEVVLDCWLDARGKQNVKIDKKLLELSRYLKEVGVYTYYFKDRVVGFSLYILGLDGKACRSEIQKTVCNTRSELLFEMGICESEEEVKALRDGLVSYIEKDLHNRMRDKGVEVIYAEGCRHNDKKMAVYKTKNYKKVIKYVNVKSEDITYEKYLESRGSTWKM